MNRTAVSVCRYFYPPPGIHLSQPLPSLSSLPPLYRVSFSLLRRGAPSAVGSLLVVHIGWRGILLLYFVVGRHSLHVEPRTHRAHPLGEGGPGETQRV